MISQSLRLTLVLACFWLFTHGLYVTGHMLYPFVYQHIEQYTSLLPETLPDPLYWAIGVLAVIVTWFVASVLMAVIRSIQWALRDNE